VEEWREEQEKRLRRLRLRRLITPLLSVASILTPIVILIVLVITIALTAYGAYSREWEWTGFLGKTLWDWMKLLLVPIILALGGLLFTQMDRLNSTRAQRLDRERLQVDREQAQNELALNRRGQIIDRFTRAIDQLGKVNDYGQKVVEIRVGGIYALEQIARASEEDYWPIMEVLTSYVRQHAPLVSREYLNGQKDVVVEEVQTSRGSSEKAEPTEGSFATPDIQAITDVLRRRNRYFGHGEPEPLDLHLTNLSGANFLQANLNRASLNRASLRGADFQGADLREADLRGADLQGADFQNANLREAYGLTQDMIEQTVGSNETKLPEDLNPPELWSKSNEVQERIVRERLGS